jgi:hypothetical protein
MIIRGNRKESEWYAWGPYVMVEVGSQIMIDQGQGYDIWSAPAAVLSTIVFPSSCAEEVYENSDGLELGAMTTGG